LFYSLTLTHHLDKARAHTHLRRAHLPDSHLTLLPQELLALLVVNHRILARMADTTPLLRGIQANSITPMVQRTRDTTQDTHLLLDNTLHLLEHQAPLQELLPLVHLGRTAQLVLHLQHPELQVSIPLLAPTLLLATILLLANILHLLVHIHHLLQAIQPMALPMVHLRPYLDSLPLLLLPQELEVIPDSQCPDSMDSLHQRIQVARSTILRSI